MSAVRKTKKQKRKKNANIEKASLPAIEEDLKKNPKNRTDKLKFTIQFITSTFIGVFSNSSSLTIESIPPSKVIITNCMTGIKQERVNTPVTIRGNANVFMLEAICQKRLASF